MSDWKGTVHVVTTEPCSSDRMRGQICKKCSFYSEEAIGMWECDFTARLSVLVPHYRLLRDSELKWCSTRPQRQLASFTLRDAITERRSPLRLPRTSFHGTGTIARAVKTSNSNHCSVCTLLWSSDSQSYSSAQRVTAGECLRRLQKIMLQQSAMTDSDSLKWKQ